MDYFIVWKKVGDTQQLELDTISHLSDRKHLKLERLNRKGS